LVTVLDSGSVAPAPPPFSPSDIAGLIAWYKADAGVYSRSAAQFTAANTEYLSITSSSTRFGNIPWTIGGWFYLDTVPAVEVLLAKGGTAGANDYVIYAQSAGSISLLTGVAEVTTTLPSLSAWHFIVGAYDGAGTISIQIDNGSIVTAATGTPPDGAGPFHLGIGQAVTLPFNGRLQNWFLFARAVDATERSFLYNSGSGRSFGEITTTDLRAWWPLDEESGTRIDKSVNANNLTDNNTVTVNDGVVVNPASNNALVYLWDDQSVSAVNLVVGVVTKQPLHLTGILNGLPVIRFDGVGDVLSGASWPAPAFYSAFIVNKSSLATIQIGVAVNSAIAQHSQILRVSAIAPENLSISLDVAQNVYACQVAGSPAVAHQQKVLRSATQIEIFRNGVGGGAAAVGGTPVSGPMSLNVGNFDQTLAGFYWGGDLSEIIIYDSALSPANQVLVEAYYLSRWGV
jgi:hypothetical protein